MEREADHQRAKYLKYRKPNKSFTKKKTPKEETLILDDTSDSDYSTSSYDDHSPDEDEKTSIAYDSDSADNDESSNSSIGSKGNILINGCRDGFIIDKVKPSGKSKIR